MTANTGTGLWQGGSSDDRCTFLTGHSGMAIRSAARERLLLRGSTGRTRPVVVSRIASKQTNASR